jgi:hypothetical protein
VAQVRRKVPKNGTKLVCVVPARTQRSKSCAKQNWANRLNCAACFVERNVIHAFAGAEFELEATEGIGFQTSSAENNTVHLRLRIRSEARR